MLKKGTALLVLSVLAGVSLASGCATVIRKSTQIIPVTTNPAGATVSVDGIRIGTTPVDVSLLRKKSGFVIRVELPGYNPVEIRPKRRLSGLPILGNLGLGEVAGLPFSDESRLFNPSPRQIWSLVGFLAFVILDINSGKGYNFSPKELDLVLTKAGEKPHLETLYLEANDLRDIERIRIRKGRFGVRAALR